MTIQEDLKDLIRRALPHATIDDVSKYVDHLMDPAKVGISDLCELKNVTQGMLVPPVPLIRAVALLEVFKGSEHAETTGTGASQDLAGPSHSRALGPRQLDRVVSYKFTVPWSSLPAETIDCLEDSKSKKETVSPDVVDALKLAIAKKLVSDYSTWKEDHPGATKHPGVTIYRSVTDEVFSKYKDCLAEKANGEVVADGKAGFNRAFLTCVENLMRPNKYSTSRAFAVVRSTGTVGVEPAEYEPQINKKEREKQEGVREQLQNIHAFAGTFWDWESVLEDMRASYELQRSDIIEAIELVFEGENKENNDNNEMADDPQGEKALERVKRLWPFLFEKACLAQHHSRLTRRSTSHKLDQFMKDHMSYLLLFLTSHSKASTENVILRIQAEEKTQFNNPGPQLMMVIKMLANHFQEDAGLLLQEVEKTTQMDELNVVRKELCIVALDTNAMMAEKFFIAADKVMHKESETFQEALVAMIELSFVLDLEYPEMPHTFEFLERYVFGMGVAESRVKVSQNKNQNKKNKKGTQEQTMVTLTAIVKKLILDFQDFEKKVKSKLAK